MIENKCQLLDFECLESSILLVYVCN